jgi:hypothetical protein
MKAGSTEARINREGFWKTGVGSMLPHPLPLGKPWVGRKRFLAALARLEKRAAVRHFRGWSTCRICGCHNGSAEYQHRGWCWPSGYSHYVEEHNVKPSLAFLEFVLGERVE